MSNPISGKNIATLKPYATINTSDVLPICSSTDVSSNDPNGTACGISIAQIASAASLPIIATGDVMAYTGAGSGAPVGTTLSALLDAVFSAVQGDILYRGASTWAVLAPGTSGQFLQTQGAGANPQWQGTSVTPGGSNGQIQYDNSGVLGGAADIAVGSAGQLNLAAIAAPGSPVVGDLWYDSTQKCHAHYGGLTSYRVGAFFVQTTNVTVTATGSNTLLSTTGAVGTLSLPAGYLNTKGRTLRLNVKGYITTGGSPGNIYFFIKLGTNVIATGYAETLTGSKTTIEWEANCLITTKSTGSSGTIDSGGTAFSGNAGGAVIPLNVFSNGTVAGTIAPGTPVTLDLTAAYTLDFQVNMSATSSTNTIVCTNVIGEVIA
jgi:hypothetical protein